VAEDENSVAPIERVNIKYKSRAEGGEDVEIPFKVMVIGDFSFRENATPLGERKPTEINKDNFDQVMVSKNLELKIQVDDKLSGVRDAALPVNLKIESLRDLTPDGIVNKVPEMKRQLELAKALQEVKADLANPAKLAALRARIDKVLHDKNARKQLEDLKTLNKEPQ
jgi:type VI secretion system protein ImpB